MTIRLILECDAPAFRNVLDSVAKERRHLAAFEAPPIERVQAFVASNVRKGHPQFVAVEAETIVGWCDAIPGDATEGKAHIGRLGMGVLKDYRGRGIGKKLLEAAIGGARKIGLEKIELSVYSSNAAAIALYKKTAFIEEGRRKNGRLVDGAYEDVVLMALFLRLSGQ